MSKMASLSQGTRKRGCLGYLFRISRIKDKQLIQLTNGSRGSFPTLLYSFVRPIPKREAWILFYLRPT